MNKPERIYLGKSGTVYIRADIHEAVIAELVKVLDQFSEFDLNEGNCASLEVASRRIRAIANAALAKLPKREKS